MNGTSDPCAKSTACCFKFLRCSSGYFLYSMMAIQVVHWSRALDKCILAEFDFNEKPLETLPFDQGKERRTCVSS